MDLDSLLVSLYVLVDDWWKADHPSSALRKPGRPVLLSESEVLTLAILAQWHRFRSERDFWRFAWAHLRPYFPMLLCSQGQLNRRIRALQPKLRELQRAFAQELACPSAVYRVMDTTLVPAIVRVEGFSQGALLRAGVLREECLQDRVGLRLQSSAGSRPARRGERLWIGRSRLRREAHRGCAPSLRSPRSLPG